MRAHNFFSIIYALCCISAGSFYWFQSQVFGDLETYLSTEFVPANLADWIIYYLANLSPSLIYILSTMNVLFLGIILNSLFKPMGGLILLIPIYFEHFFVVIPESLCLLFIIYFVIKRKLHLRHLMVALILWPPSLTLTVLIWAYFNNKKFKQTSSYVKIWIKRIVPMIAFFWFIIYLHSEGEIYDYGNKLIDILKHHIETKENISWNRLLYSVLFFIAALLPILFNLKLPRPLIWFLSSYAMVFSVLYFMGSNHAFGRYLMFYSVVSFGIVVSTINPFFAKYKLV